MTFCQAINKRDCKKQVRRLVVSKSKKNLAKKVKISQDQPMIKRFKNQKAAMQVTN
jgi:hypothetical protein